MKIAIRIFTIYMIILSVIPCGDGGGGVVEIASHFLGITTGDAHHEEHSNTCGDDFCSPFCICSCCASVLDYPTRLTLQIKVPTPLQNKKPSFSYTLVFSSFNTAVWQPPKLG